MAQFNYLNEINNVLTLEGDLTRGQMPRWQKKLDISTSSQNSSINTSKPKLSISYNGYAAAAAAASNKTPNKASDKNSKSPSSKSPGRKTPTPNKGATRTPSGGDRFIPSRAGTNFELGHYMVSYLG